MMKELSGISFCSILFFVVLSIVVIFLIICSIISAEAVTAIATLLSFGVAAYAACYAKEQYLRHLEVEHTKLLCGYNQRYSTDCNIKAMLRWMLEVAVTDEKGEIINVDLTKCCYSPGINTKEMFMRFFEELYLQIEKGNLNANEVYDLFAYYALKFDEFDEYHEDITDYTAKEEVDKMDKDKMDAVNENWKRFSKFIQIMDEIKNNSKNTK